jgi:cyclic pyranopterin monophosphate synthase
MNFKHFDEQGHAVMVTVSSKQETVRTATAAADIHLSAALLQAIEPDSVSKGDVLEVARLAGIMALSLCYPAAGFFTAKASE